MRAMVVDDSRAMRGLLARILKEIGFEVSEAAHGAQALEILRSGARIDLALVDCNMPDMDGFELVRNIRADRSLGSIRVLMVTTECEIDKVETALQAGVDDYIMKPFTRDVITEKVAMLDLGAVLPVR
jgi:two-component system chemotaxis response regulator CheY